MRELYTRRGILYKMLRAIPVLPLASRPQAVQRPAIRSRLEAMLSPDMLHRPEADADVAGQNDRGSVCHFTGRRGLRGRSTWAALAPRGEMRAVRVLSRSEPGMPLATNRRTDVLLVPVRWDSAIVPQPPTVWGPFLHAESHPFRRYAADMRPMPHRAAWAKPGFASSLAVGSAPVGVRGLHTLLICGRSIEQPELPHGRGLLAPGWMPQSEVSNLVQTLRQNMLQEPAHELMSWNTTGQSFI
jgi:hypothetical protein